MATRIEVDKQSCASSGRCVNAARDVFRLDDDFLADLIPNGPALEAPRALEIARTCPTQAIRVFDENGEELEP